MRILVLILCLVAGPVWAIDEERAYSRLGMGASSCGEVIERYRTDWNLWEHVYTSHINGCITAYNYLKAGKMNWADDKDTSSWLTTIHVVFYPKGSVHKDHGVLGSEADKTLYIKLKLKLKKTENGN
jgi:hypothetical protein